jgi:hypothetical protein
LISDQFSIPPEGEIPFGGSVARDISKQFYYREFHNSIIKTFKTLLTGDVLSVREEIL